MSILLHYIHVSTMDPLVFVAASTLISLAFTVFYVKRSSKEVRNTLDALGSQLEEGIQGINEELAPIIKTNSTAMGFFQSKGDETRMDTTLDRRIGQDMMDQYGDVLEGVKLAFPRVAEYLEERPEALTKLMPRLNALISDPEARKRLNLDVSGSKSDVSRIWRES